MAGAIPSPLPPVLFVERTDNTNTATYTFTVTTSTPEGALLMVAAGSAALSNSVSCHDSQGNTYTLVASSTANESVQAYVANAAAPLTGGVDSITVTWGSVNTQQKNVIGFYIQGALAYDFGASNNGSSGTATISMSPANYDNDYMIAIVQGANGTQPFGALGGTLAFNFFAAELAVGQQVTACYWAWNVGQPHSQSLAVALHSSNQWGFLLVSLQYTLVAAAPSYPNFIAGSGPQQGDMQSVFQLPLAFFQQRVVFRAIQALAATTLPSSGSLVNIAFDVIQEDPYSGWQVTATNQWTAPFSGWYKVTLNVWTVAPASANVVLLPEIRTSAVTMNSGPAVGIPLSNTLGGGGEISWTIYMVGGSDTVTGNAAIQNSAGNVNTSQVAGRQSSMEIIWLSA